MRIPSGVTDQVIYFVAVDATDLKTRETGLSSFTVYRSRNGGSATAYTTPTVTEVSSGNMPGVYKLLLDEDMTINSGDQSQEVCLHITATGMAPVTRVFELYRVSVTAGETLTVASGVGQANVTQFGSSNGTFSSGRPEVNTSHIAGSAVSTSSAQIGVNVVNAAGTAWNSGAIGPNTLASDTITSAKIAADAIGASELASDAGTEIATAVWANATRSLTILDEDSTTIDIDNSVWGGGTRTLTSIDEDSTTLDLDNTIRSAIGLASANLDTQLTGINSNIDANEAKIDIIDSNVDAILVDTGTDIPASIVTVNSNIDANEAKIDIIDSNVDSLIADIGADGVGLTAIPWNAAWDAEVESEVTDALTAYDVATGSDVSGVTAPTVDQIADEIETRTLDVNIKFVNHIEVAGTGVEGDTWGPV